MPRPVINSAHNHHTGNKVCRCGFIVRKWRDIGLEFNTITKLKSFFVYVQTNHWIHISTYILMCLINGTKTLHNSYVKTIQFHAIINRDDSCSWSCIKCIYPFVIQYPTRHFIIPSYLRYNLQRWCFIFQFSSKFRNCGFVIPVLS